MKLAPFLAGALWNFSALPLAPSPFIQLSERVVSLCKWYVTSPKDLRTIMIEAGSVKPVVSNLGFFMSTWATDDMFCILKDFEEPEGPIGISWL